MPEQTLRVRANRAMGELEVEGTSEKVSEWWERLWPEISQANSLATASTVQSAKSVSHGQGSLPDVFGEFYTEFQSGLTDVNRMLIAGAFVQSRDPDRTFTTKTANQLLMDQNVKLTNPSECVRRLIQGKRAFVVSEGRFRVSATGFDHLQTLKNN